MRIEWNEAPGDGAGVSRGQLSFDAGGLSDWSWPVCEIRGAAPGPRLCVSAGVHVNEVAAIEAAVRLQSAFDPTRLRGTVSIIPLINQPARFEYTEYLCPLDGRNINFTFPGRADGSFSEMLCHAITTEWCRDSDCYVDMHGGDLRENVSKFSIYQRTGDAAFDDQARQLARCFDAEIIAGLPPADMEAYGRPPTGFARARRFSIMSEAGSNGIIDEVSVRYHVEGVLRIARHLGMTDTALPDFIRGRVNCSDYIWVPAPETGEFHPMTEPGEAVSRGQVLGRMRDLFGRDLVDVTAPVTGLVLWRMTHPTLRRDMPVLAIAVPEPVVGDPR